ncbi:hypothetical protein SB783_35485 [Paraburkholderia sp. SIMBA_009]
MVPYPVPPRALRSPVHAAGARHQHRVSGVRRRSGLVRRFDRPGPSSADREHQLHSVHDGVDADGRSCAPRADEAAGGWDSAQTYPKPKEFAAGPQYGTPYAGVVKPWPSLLDASCNAPPWGKLGAIDLQTKEIAWERPVGATRDMNLFNTHANAQLPTGIFMPGGKHHSASGLIFMGATADDYIRAFDEHSGRQLWKARLPAGGQARPITYIGNDGRQYVVIAAGGLGGLRTNLGDSNVPFAVPGSMSQGH